MNEIVKEQSLSHRAEFNKALAKNAVRSKHVGDMVLEKNFSKMTDAEKRQIADYIKDNARKFRTKMSRKYVQIRRPGLTFRLQSRKAARQEVFR